MSAARGGPDRIDVLAGDDPRDAVHRAVACLVQGGVVALPSESGYVLAASAVQPAAVERLRALKGRGPAHPLSLSARSAPEAADWVPDLSEAGRKLAGRAWPGPVTLVIRGDVAGGLAARLPASVRSAVAPSDTIGLRMPAHPIPAEVRDLVPGPLALTAAPGAGPGAPPDLDGLDMLLDEGPPPEGAGNTVAFLDGEALEVRRAGRVAEADLRGMMGRLVLFVCTGNTCRSPMAEALLRVALAERLGCDPRDVASRGFVAASAGLSAYRGSPAASEAIEAVRDRGGSLLDHRSRPVTPHLVASADLIVAMTADHRDALLDDYPEAAGLVRLLDPRGDDVPDPIGSDRATYRRTANVIAGHVRSLLDAMGV